MANNLNYTKEQELAIFNREKNILVSAAAGSGKTRVLVDRVIELVKEGNSIDKMLIITFTVAAASEMRDRIETALEAAVKEASEKDKEYLTEQINLLNRANISTLHAYCLRLIKKYFYKLGLDADVNNIDERQKSILKNKILDNVLLEFYKNSTEETENIVCSYSNRYDTYLKSIVRFFVSIINKKENPETWFETAFGYMDMELSQFLRSDLFVDELNRLKTKLQVALKTNNERYILAAEITDEKFKEKVLKTINADNEIIEEATGLINNLKIETLISFINELEFENKYRVGKNLDVEIKYITDKDARKRDKLKGIIKDLKEDYPISLIDNYTKHMAYSKKVMKQFLELAIEFNKQYKTEKNMLNLVDYDDMEHLSLELLKDEKVVEEIRNNISYIFFDEYQDANEIQEAIIEKIKKTNNLFFVGDIKQSIYRFRQAEPRLFANRYKNYNEDKDSLIVDLFSNFRSSKEILSFANIIFKRLMTTEFGGIDYNSKNHILEYARIEKEEKKESSIDLVFIDKEEADSSNYNNDENNENYENYEKEEVKDKNEIFKTQQYYIGKKIKELVDSGKFKYRDIAILSAALSYRTEYYEEVFKFFGIPYYIEKSSVKFDTAEIKFFIDLLIVIDDPENEAELIKVLLSYIGGFDEIELATIRQNSIRENEKKQPEEKSRYNKDSFFKAFWSYKNDDEIKVKIEKFKKFLSYWNDEKMNLKLGDFVWNLYTKTAYDLYLSKNMRGKYNIFNIEAFLSVASDFGELYNSGIKGLLFHIEDLKKADEMDLNPMAVSDRADVVRVMTIHKSKGLQFPVVFLANMEASIVYKNKGNVVDNEKHLAIKYANFDEVIKEDTLFFKAISNQNNKRDLEEKIRLLYVAITRAEESLYIVMEKEFEKILESVRNIEDEPNNLNGLGDSYMKWILNILFNNKAYEKYYNDEVEIELRDDFKDTYVPGLTIIKKESLIDDMTEEKNKYEELHSNDIDDEFTEKYKNAQKFIYKSDESLPFSKSVTNIVKKDISENQAKAIQGKLKVDYKGFKPAEVGVILHRVFEFINIEEKNKDTINTEINNMIENGILSEKESKLVEDHMISNFVNSDFVKNIIKNKYKIKRETPFKMWKDGYVLNGIVDMYYETEEGIVILDFKSDIIMDENTHKEQLALYKEALEEALDKKVEHAYIYWIRYGEFTEYNGGDL